MGYPWLGRCGRRLRHKRDCPRSSNDLSSSLNKTGTITPAMTESTRGAVKRTGGLFDAVRREDLIGSSSGVRYRQFRSTLTPRWSRVWLDLALGYVSLMALAAAA